MDLMNLLPPIYEDNTTMQELQSILSTKITSIISDTGATIDECFIETASKLLSRYEKIYGVTVDVSKSDTLRREILKAKIRGVGTVTKQLLIDTAASYSNGTVEVIEDPANYKFIVKFTGTIGIPPNMDGLTNTINEIKPAHLAFEYEYIYNTWADLSALTWGALSSKTWDQVRGEKLT